MTHFLRDDCHVWQDEGCTLWRTSTVEFTNSTVEVRHRSHIVTQFYNTSELYESKFILDSFLFRVSPARFLRRLAAIINIFPRSRVCLVTYLALTRGDFNTIGFYRWHFHTVMGFLRALWYVQVEWGEHHPNALLAIHPISYQNCPTFFDIFI